MKIKSVFLCLFALIFAINVFAQQEESFEAGIVNELSGEINELGRLAEKKELVKKLADKGDQATILRLFKSDAAVMDEVLAKKELNMAADELNNMKIVYGQVDFLRSRLAYYEARNMILEDRLSLAQYSLEEYINDTSNTEKRKDAIYWLEYVYFMSGKDRELITLHKNHYNWEEDDSQKFWLGNAYYNLSDISTAETIFTSLKTSALYGEKADIMLSLIGYSEYGLEYAIERFLEYIEDKGDSGANIDFVYLSLGRLYQEKNDFAKAMYCYERYNELTKEEPTNEFWYELFLLAIKNEKYEEGTRYLSYILSGPNTGDYFNSANYLYAVMYQLTGELNKADEEIQKAISEAEKISELLVTKERLMDKIKVLKDKHAQTSDPEERAKIAEKLEKFNEAARSSSDILVDITTGVSDDDILKLAILEEEYFSYNGTINEMENMIYLLETTSNKKIPKIMDNRIEEIDEEILRFKTMRSLANLENFTVEDYQLAYLLNSEIYYMDKVVDTYRSLEKHGQKKNKPQIVESARKNQELLNDLKLGLEAITVSSFGDVDSTALLQQVISEEIKSAELLKENYTLTRKLVVKNFNKVLAKRVKKEKVLLDAENKKIYTTYSERIKGFQERLKEIDQRYNFTKLDILYARAKEFDDGFKLLQEDYKNASSVNKNIENPETQSGE